MFKRISIAAAMLAATTAPAFAHINPAEHGSLLAGLSHPFSGADHMLAMIAVGLWAAQTGGRARLMVPAAFIFVMALGFMLALTGASLPFVEPAILASVVGLGLLVALAVRVPSAVSMALVGIFALFHGYAHGGELGGASAVSFGMGFMIATTILHAIGLGSGMAMARGHQAMTRAFGAVVAAGGAALMFAG